MPTIQIDLLERNLEQKRAIVKNVTQAMVDAIQVDPNTVTIIIREIPRESLGKAGLLRCDR